MSEARPDTEPQPSSPTTERGSGILGRLSVLTEPRWLAVVLFLAGVLVSLAYGPFKQREVGDSAIYDYIAQSMLRGRMPYRDVIEMKSPGSIYPSVLAIAVGRLTGLGDVRAIRLLYVLLAGLFSAVIFLTAHIYLRSRMAGVIASLLPLSVSQLSIMLNGGTEPKLLMMTFGLISMMLLLKDRPFWSGLFSMLSCLCWQPGLMFTGLSFLMFSRYLTSWRDLRALKVIIGAAVPLLAVLGYFYWRGALGDLWAWTITYNYGVFGPEARQGAGDAVNKLWRIVLRVFRPDTASLADTLIGRFKSRFEPFAGLATFAMVPASIIGALLFGFERVRAKLAGKQAIQSPELFRDALLIPPLVYLGFCLVNFQAGPDLIPFFPFIGIFAAWFLIKAGRLIASRWLRHSTSAVPPEIWLPLGALLLILIVLAVRTVTYRVGGWTLQYQDQEFRTISDLLGPDDKIYVHGTVELLVLLNRPNLNPYVLLDWDADKFAGARTPGGWSAIMDEMESQAPKLVAVSRLRTVTYRADIERWIDEHYDRVDLFRYDRVFVRKAR